MPVQQNTNIPFLSCRFMQHLDFISTTNGMTFTLDVEIYFAVPAPGPYEKS